HVGRVAVSRGRAPLLEAGATSDPLVGTIHHSFHIGIGQNFLRHVGADRGDGAKPAPKTMLRARVFDDFAGRGNHAAAVWTAALTVASRSFALAISWVMSLLMLC